MDQTSSDSSEKTEKLSVREQAGAARAMLDAAAAARVEQGTATELHPVVGNNRACAVAQTYTYWLIAFSILGLASPRLGCAALLFGLVCGAYDLEGGHSLVRRLTPRTGGRALLSWVTSPPRSGDRALLIVVPQNAVTPAHLGRISSILFALGLASLGACVARPFAVEATTLTLLAVAAAGVGCLALTWLSAHRRHKPSDAGSGIRLADRLLKRLGARASDDCAVGIATITGGAPFYDGLRVFLQNQRGRLPASETLVVSWSPEQGPLRCVSPEGRWLRRPALSSALARAEQLGIPSERGLSGASVARREGWNALGLVGGLDQPAELVARLDELTTSLWHTE